MLWVNVSDSLPCVGTPVVLRTLQKYANATARSEYLLVYLIRNGDKEMWKGLYNTDVTVPIKDEDAWMLVPMAENVFEPKCTGYMKMLSPDDVINLIQTANFQDKQVVDETIRTVKRLLPQRLVITGLQKIDVAEWDHD